MNGREQQSLVDEFNIRVPGSILFFPEGAPGLTITPPSRVIGFIKRKQNYIAQLDRTHGRTEVILHRVPLTHFKIIKDI